jgi:arginase
MVMTRRRFVQNAAALMTLASAWRLLAASKSVSIILAPSNLGLRPSQPGHQPGTWRAPEILMGAGLASVVNAREVLSLQRPTYAFEAQAGTRIRNGQSIRAFSVQLKDAVDGVLQEGGFPFVIGGDCSVLLGGLYGLRRAGGRGLVHIDGHSDFYQIRSSDAGHLGAAAGMDLALASGRGEALLTDWPEVGTLARDQNIIQIGERDSAGDRSRIPDTGITQITAQRALADGMHAVAAATVEKLTTSRLDRAWLHVDLDVLDQSVMAAVDSPGSPGMTFEQLGELVQALCASGRIAGADFSIYDPERDSERHYARPIVECIARGIRATSVSRE